MSTRANIKLIDGDEELWFYRHSGGYPEGTMPTLQKFCNWVKEKKIRNNVGQAAGWLIIIGAIEYKNSVLHNPHTEPAGENSSSSGWKVGAYEPTTCQHPDIEYLYVVDVKTGTCKCSEVHGGYGDIPVSYEEQDISEFVLSK